MSVPKLPLHSELWRATCDWEPTPALQETFQQLYAGILAGNQQLNLTRIVDPEEFWEKHLWDSLRGLAPLGLLAPDAAPEPFRAIDIGTGGGFPGLPLAIANPHIDVVLLDSTRKKVAFLETLAAELGCDRVTSFAERAETAGRDSSHRGTYNLAMLRAVGSASVCAEYALPLLEVGGLALLYRGQWNSDETEPLARAAEQLGGNIERIDAYTTPLTGGDRHCLHLRKLAPTPPQYPRAIGVPTKKPL